MVTPLKTFMGFLVHLNVQLIFYNLSNHKIKIKINSNSKIVLHNCNSIFTVEFGFKGTPFVSNNYSSSLTLINSILEIHGPAVIAQGMNVFLDNGSLVIGSNLYINKNVTIQCTGRIEIGNDSLLGWNVSIRDTDGHSLTGKSRFEKKNIITIESNTWIAANTTLLKGTFLAEGCVVATGSILVGLVVEKENCLIAGIPAKIKKQEVTLIC